MENENKISTKGYPWNKESLVVTRKIVWKCPTNIHKKWVSLDGKVTIINDLWYIDVGYKFDSCTWVESGRADKTPDLPVKSLTDQPVHVLWFGALIHDIGYDNLGDNTFPFKRYEMDVFFYCIISEVEEFDIPTLYYYGVRVFGGIFAFVGGVQRTWKSIWGFFKK